MHYVQKYLDKLQTPMANDIPISNGCKTNILLYCNYYSFYSQKVCRTL